MSTNLYETTYEDHVIIDKLIQQYDRDSLAHAVESKHVASQYEKKRGVDNTLLSTVCEIADIGKIYISDRILNKPDRLSPLEALIVKMHPYYGYMLLQDMGVSENVCNIVLFHHGLLPPHIGEIPTLKPELSKFIKQVDTIDRFVAVQEDRPYRKGCSLEQAIEFIENDAESDPDVVLFLRENYFGK